MGELVDLVDATGEVQVIGVPREEALANTNPELFVPISVAVIFNGLGQVLVQQRSRTKPVDRERLDFVCGVVWSGEDPAETAVRESVEETTVWPSHLRQIARGVNEYRRYRHLFVGETHETGAVVSIPNREVEWAAMLTRQEILTLLSGGKYKPVGDFSAHLMLATVGHHKKRHT